MDRKEVEALLAETKDPLIAALCRTQLAVWDAAALEVDERGWREGGPNDGVVYEVPTELVGQRVRIVPEDE